MATVIRNASWGVVWDEAAGRHAYARDIDIAFEDAAAGGRIVHVGPGYATAEGDTEIDGRDLMVMPGLVNIHTHPTSEPLLRGLTEERKSRQFFMSTLYEFIMLVGRSQRTMTLEESEAAGLPVHEHHDEGARRAAAKLAVWEMLKSGVTTFVDYSPMRPAWVEDLSPIGIRTCYAPSFRSGNWYTPNGREVMYDWDEPAGIRAFHEAMEFLDGIAGMDDDMHLSMVAPGQIDTCTPELLRLAHEQAHQRNLPWTVHTSQSVVEFREMMRRHGVTPVAWLEGLGLLSDHLILGHAIFLDHHSWIRWPDHEDLGRLVRHGVSVAHCPNQFARGGVTLEHFGRYVKEGVRMAIGTDTHPHNMLDEMRWAAVLAKVASADVDGASAASVFHAATVGGAEVLRRPDLGRLATGCKADLVLVDLTSPFMQPARDPLRSLLFSAQDRAVRDVYVNGSCVVRGGAPLTIDVAEAADELTRGQARALPGIPHRDYAKRTPEEAFPLALPWL